MCAETVEGAIFLVVSHDTLACAILHDQVNGEELDEVLGVVTQRLTVQGVEERVAGSVSSSAASVCLTALAILLRLTAESSLVAMMVSVGFTERSIEALQRTFCRPLFARMGNHSSPTQ